MAQSQSRNAVLNLAFLASGLAALGYEILWTRLLSLALGSEMLAVLGVLAGFFGGMALGAALLHGPVRRSASPLKLFALFEGVAAAYALASPWLLGWLAGRLPTWLAWMGGQGGAQLIAALILAGLVLLPATLPMGATLAALVETRRRLRREEAGRGIGVLYALNTLGAALGVLLTVHLLLPRLGVTGAAVGLAVCGFVAALLAWSVAQNSGNELRRSGGDRSPSDGIPSTTSKSPQTGTMAAAKAETKVKTTVPERAVRTGHGPLLLLLFLSGLAGVGLEVLGLRVLSQVLKGTIYTFAHLLAIWLLGTALGAVLYARFAARRLERSPGGVFPLALLALASALLSALALRASPQLLNALLGPGSAAGAWYLAELTVAAAVFGPVTVAMGALFSRLLAPFSVGGVGRAYALNTLGGLLAPFLFGPLAIGLWGYAGAMLALIILYGLIALLAALLIHSKAASVPDAARTKSRRGAGTRSPRFGRPAALTVAALLLVLACAAAPRSLLLIEAEEGWRTLAVRETIHGGVLVSEFGDAIGGQTSTRRLRIGRHYSMGGGLSFGERRMGHLPLLLCPGTRSAVFLGVGTGATMGAASAYEIERTLGFELVPEVLDLLPLFERVNDRIWDKPRVELRAADARRGLAALAEPVDLIVADLFHPARDGAAFLYTREHFDIAARRLTPTGAFAQWLPLYQLDERGLKLILRSFLDVFPATRAYLGLYNAEQPNLLLMGRAEGRQAPRLDLSELATLLRPEGVPAAFVDGPRDLLAGYLCDGEALRAWAGEGPRNLDLNPRLLFAGPACNYRRDPARGARLLRELLPIRNSFPAALLLGSEEEVEHLLREAKRYGRALARFLEADMARVLAPAAPRLREMVLKGYLEAYRLDPSFAPARGALSQAAAREPGRAAAIHEAMLRVTPRDARLMQAYYRILSAEGRPERLAGFLRELRDEGDD